jgi:hypothetical protein
LSKSSDNTYSDLQATLMERKKKMLTFHYKNKYNNYAKMNLKLYCCLQATSMDILLSKIK